MQISFITMIEICLTILGGILLGVIVGFGGIPALLLVPLILSFLILLGFINNKLNLFHYVAVLIPVIIFSPPIRLSGLPAIRLDDFWLIFGLLLLVAKYSFNQKRFNIPEKSIIYSFIAFLVWITITIFISSFRESYNYSNRDWFEIIKNLKLLVVFLIAANLNINKSQHTKIVNIMIFSLFVSAIFGFAQFFNFVNINSWLTPYFIAETQVSGLENHGRIVSFFGNSNVFAGALLIGIGLSLSLLINKAKLIQLIPLTSFITALFFTLSRTGLVCAVMVISYVLFLSFWRSKKKLRLIIIGLIASFVPFIALSFAPEKFFFRIGFLGDISNDSSFSARIMIWKSIFEERVKGNLITGTGPVSKLHYFYDNEWLQILTNYGVVGIVIFLVIFTNVFLRLGKIGKVDKELTWLTTAWQGILIAFALYMITLAVFQQLQLMPLIMAGLGLTMSSAKKEEVLIKRKHKKITWRSTK